MGLFLAVGLMLAACVGDQTHPHDTPAAAKSSPSPQDSAPQFPVADSGGKVDAASQQKADSWLAGAVVPPGAVRSSTRPDVVATEPAPEMWCKPMAHAIGYWTLSSMSADDTMTWLESHPSQGMVYASASGNPRVGDETNVGGFVVYEPTHMSLEALIFTVTPTGSGSGIRAEAFAKATNSVCATPAPGTMLGIGG
jgi:hypothetical protein